MRQTLLELSTLCVLGAALGCSKPTSDPTRSLAWPTETNASAASVFSASNPTLPLDPTPPLGVTKGKAAPHRSQPTAKANEGQRLYARYCRLCHGEGAQGYAADNAPSLVTKSFLESATDEFIARAIAMGRPHTAMAAYSKERGGPLSDAEISAIVAHIRSLGPAAMPQLEEMKFSGNATAGKALFEAQCQKCHGTATERGNALSLHNSELLAAATPAFLRHAIVHGRQGTPMPAYAGILREQQIADVVSYLQTFAPKQATARVRTQVSNDGPVVIHPKGAAPRFTLRSGRFVSSEQVNEALRQRQRIVIVDARSPADWIQLRIPGSIPVAYYDAEGLSRIPNDGTWVVAYCACPHHASGAVVDALRKRGYKHTAVLDEGILFWEKQGYPVEGESVARDGRTPR